MRIIIGLVGMKGSGKDYTAQKLKEFYQKSGRSVSIINFADPVRQAVYKVLQIPAPKSDEEYTAFKTKSYSCYGTTKTGREWLEHIGEGSRIATPLCWTNEWLRVCKFNQSEVIITTDCRHEHELLAVRYEALRRGVPHKFRFCDFKSDRYDASTDTILNNLALSVQRRGWKDQEDITNLFN